jgi:hypothetical protein
MLMSYHEPAIVPMYLVSCYKVCENDTKDSESQDRVIKPCTLFIISFHWMNLRSYKVPSFCYVCGAKV